MALRTDEKLKQLLQQQKEIQQRKREREKQRYLKASQSIKKALDKKRIKEQKQTQQKQNKTHFKSKAVSIYHSNVFQRETAEEDLYNSWDEIKAAEERGEGALNWDFLWELINKVREQINSSKQMITIDQGREEFKDLQKRKQQTTDKKELSRIRGRMAYLKRKFGFIEEKKKEHDKQLSSQMRNNVNNSIQSRIKKIEETAKILIQKAKTDDERKTIEESLYYVRLRAKYSII